MQIVVNVNPHECPTCGVAFCLSARIEKARMEDGSNFYCPNGHVMNYRESEKDKLQKQLDAERSKTLRLTREADSCRIQLSTLKGQLTRAKNAAAKKEDS